MCAVPVRADSPGVYWNQTRKSPFSSHLHTALLALLFTGKVVPEEALDQYETMKGKLGNNAELEKMTRGFVRLAKKVSFMLQFMPSWGWAHQKYFLVMSPEIASSVRLFTFFSPFI